MDERLCDDDPVRRTALIVDDHAGFRHSARTLLELEGFEVVGEAADGASRGGAGRKAGPAR